MDEYLCSCGKSIKYSSVGNHVKTAYHKKVLELKADNDKLLTRLVEERVNNVNLKMDYDRLKNDFLKIQKLCENLYDGIEF